MLVFRSAKPSASARGGKAKAAVPASTSCAATSSSAATASAASCSSSAVRGSWTTAQIQKLKGAHFETSPEVVDFWDQVHEYQ